MLLSPLTPRAERWLYEHIAHVNDILTALDEAAHVARGRLAGDEAGRFAARMVEKKRQPLSPAR